MNKSSKIYVAGHRGMVGSAIARLLTKNGFENLVLRGSDELDLRDQDAVRNLFEKEKPECVFLAAARAGGILANASYPAQFLYDNLLIQANVIHQSYVHGVKKLLFLGSSCAYPKLAPQPIKEEYLLTGPLESTLEPYAIAKIAGIKMCETYRRQYGCNFICAMPCNLYGPNDHYDQNNSHVLAALLRKFHEGTRMGLKEVTLWGSGTPRREFLHADDAAAACLFLMENYSEPAIINVGAGSDLSIADLADIIKRITGFRGSIAWDRTKPDGTLGKLLDVSRIGSLGWQPGIDLIKGVTAVYEDAFLSAREVTAD